MTGPTVVLAPDSFKGSLSASRVAAALAEGLLEVRPDADIVRLPLADGGEGTLDAILAAQPDAEVHRTTVTLPTGSHQARWLTLPDRTAVVELAECCGLPLLGTSRPLHASSEPLGVVLMSARSWGAQRIVLGVGGSASTDGGAGLLRALGARLRDGEGAEVASGGAALADLAAVDLTALAAPPPDGVLVLCDVDAPLFGPRGAARVFAPQKGANPAQVEQLDRALRRWAQVLRADPDVPGSGAAGGVPYGLSAAWPTTLTSGADYLAEVAGLERRIVGAALVVTGEGRFDEQSLTGKLPGRVLALAQAHGTPAVVVAGSIAAAPPAMASYALVDLAADAAAAIAAPERYLRHIGRMLAEGSLPDRASTTA